MFSQTTEYALRAMACLALRPQQLTSAIALADQTKVPANYLAKVLQQLAGAGLIDGRRGVGGFRDNFQFPNALVSANCRELAIWVVWKTTVRPAGGETGDGQSDARTRAGGDRSGRLHLLCRVGWLNRAARFCRYGGKRQAGEGTRPGSAGCAAH